MQETRKIECHCIDEVCMSLGGNRWDELVFLVHHLRSYSSFHFHYVTG